MAPYPRTAAFRYSLFVALQRVWYRCEALIAVAFRVLPRLLNLVIFRTLAKRYGVVSVVTDGAFGRIAGSPMDIAMFGEYLTTHTYSPMTLQAILDFFRDNGSKGTFIDIGGHVGLMSIPVSQSGDIRCLTFEPDARNFSFLRENIDRCGVAGKVAPHELALFDRATTVEFEISDWHHGDHRIRNTQGVAAEVLRYAPYREDVRQVVTVRTVRLDDVVDADSLPQPIVVKIDTQGAETHILRGGEATLSRASLLVTEYCPYMIRRMGGDPMVLLDFLHRHFRRGFVHAQHNRGEPVVLEDIERTVAFLDAFTARAKLDFVDVIAVK